MDMCIIYTYTMGLYVHTLYMCIHYTLYIFVDTVYLHSAWIYIMYRYTMCALCVYCICVCAL